MILFNYTTTNCILFKVKGFRIRHAIDDSLEVSLLPALRAGEGAKWRATFSGHRLIVVRTTDIDSLQFSKERGFKPRKYLDMSVDSPRL